MFVLCLNSAANSEDTMTLHYALLAAACLLSTSWVVVANQQLKKLKTRDGDGAPLCARDEPSRRAMISAAMSSAPAVVGCSMTCSTDHQCRHFNYVATESLHPCHLYYYRPAEFEVRSNCRHYQMPGKLLRFVTQTSADRIVRKSARKFANEQ